MLSQSWEPNFSQIPKSFLYHIVIGCVDVSSGVKGVASTAITAYDPTLPTEPNGPSELRSILVMSVITKGTLLTNFWPPAVAASSFHSKIPQLVSCVFNQYVPFLGSAAGGSEVASN